MNDYQTRTIYLFFLNQNPCHAKYLRTTKMSKIINRVI